MRLLVTAGPTREYFDTVRFISNASTGKLGYAIARRAHERGHEVVLVSGPVVIEPPPVTCIHVVSASEMLDACVSSFAMCEAAVMAAAVSDWKPAHRADHKTPKKDKAATIDLVPTEDICARLGAGKGDRVLVGFALQDRDERRRAEEKMRRKSCDAIVMNTPATLGSDRARIEIKVAEEPWSEPIEGEKSLVAGEIVGLVERLAAARRAE